MASQRRASLNGGSQIALARAASVGAPLVKAAEAAAAVATMSAAGEIHGAATSKKHKKDKSMAIGREEDASVNVTQGGDGAAGVVAPATCMPPHKESTNLAASSGGALSPLNAATAAFMALQMCMTDQERQLKLREAVGTTPTSSAP